MSIFFQTNSNTDFALSYKLKAFLRYFFLLKMSLFNLITEKKTTKIKEKLYFNQLAI